MEIPPLPGASCTVLSTFTSFCDMEKRFGILTDWQGGGSPFVSALDWRFKKKSPNVYCPQDCVVALES